MWDRKALFNLITLALYVLGFNFYLYELFFGTWYSVNVKGFYYLITIIFLVCNLFISKIVGQYTYLSEQLELIGRITVIINFTIIVLTLYNQLCAPVTYFFVFNSSILIATTMVMINGFKHGIFKK